MMQTPICDFVNAYRKGDALRLHMPGHKGKAHIGPEEMIGFGDEANDLPLLKYVGHAYVMENGPENVRREIRRMAPKNTEAGLAKIVNQYLDEGKMGRS